MTEPASTWLVPQLRAWANWAWMRFGGDCAVYLVGSSLHKDDPRDLDLVVVLKATRFAQRYGDVHANMHINDEVLSEPTRRWARETAGLVHWLCHVVGARLPPDLRIIDDYANDQYKDAPRLRLDNIHVEEA